MTYEIVSIQTEKNTIKMNHITAQQLGLSHVKRIIITFGKAKDEAWIEENNSLQNGVIEIEQSIITYLHIEPSAAYEIKYRNQQLLIGPVIGLLVSKKVETLRENLELYLAYTIGSQHINGLLFIFAEEQINFSQNTVAGYWYNPKSNSWTESTFPFPSVLFRRVSVSDQTFRSLTRVMGTKLYNSYFFDKWEFWRWIESFPSLITHVPQTDNQISKEMIDQWITKYGSVYLKPINGSRGKGIYLITKNDEGYEIRDKMQKTGNFLHDQEFNEFLHHKTHHLLQQPINTKTYNERKVDYRVAVLKDINNTWFCAGAIGRFGKKSGVTSNYQRFGFAREAFEAIKLQFDCNAKEAYKKYEAMCQLATQFAATIDHISGPYVELGMDLAFDEEGKIWLIEVNKRQDYSIFRSLKNKKIYYTIKLHPLRYAKQLAMDEL